MEEIAAGPVTLRALDTGDADDLVAACNDPLIQRFLPPSLPNPYTHEDALAFVTEVVPASVASGGVQLAIAEPGGGRLLGAVGIHGRRMGCGEVGYWVAPWGRRRGAATAAVTALSAWAFDHGFARLELRTEPENALSQRVAIGAGFTWECLQRAAGDGPDGTRRDLIQWVRLPGDAPGPGRRALPDLPGGVLTDGVVTLRPVGAGDADDIYAMRARPEVVRMSAPAPPPEYAALARECARGESTWLAGDRAHLTIRDAATGAFAGEIVIRLNVRLGGQAMTGYNLAPDWRGRGYASGALRLLMAWAFGPVGLARVEAGTAVDNTASHRVLDAVGFRREGRLRSVTPGPDGPRADGFLYGLLRDELRLTPTRTRPR
jgi:RimJ/RimL family protein N-acetyltransferase